MSTLILGLGNPIMKDDGAGVLVARALRAYIPQTGAVDVEEVSIGGLRLMEAMLGYRRVILVDAILDDGIPCGEFRRLSLDDLTAISPTQHAASPHDAGLLTALEAGKSMGLPVPPEIVIYAIGVQQAGEFGDQTTPAVAAAIPRVAAAILKEIDVR